MCDKTVNTCSCVCDFVSDQYMTQEMSDKLVSEEPFLSIYCLNTYKTQEICDQAVDFYLVSLKFVP